MDNKNTISCCSWYEVNILQYNDLVFNEVSVVTIKNTQKHVLKKVFKPTYPFLNDRQKMNNMTHTQSVAIVNDAHTPRIVSFNKPFSQRCNFKTSSLYQGTCSVFVLISF